ncbi:MAG: hypothetical protein N4Q32_00880 [Neisseriaceae bacterium]|nr:hypothetical protein [Neisseriaceae bacterium PsAf]MCV2508978.1 hypothetical protein [Neisseriaceae bacterium]
MSAIGDKDPLAYKKINQRILKGKFYIYQQKQKNNRSDLVKTINIQDMHIDYADVILRGEPVVMAHTFFEVQRYQP